MLSHYFSSKIYKFFDLHVFDIKLTCIKRLIAGEKIWFFSSFSSYLSHKLIKPIRNKSSIAHPNDELLSEAEAMFAINCARSILQYLDSII
jgi:hypothetical protein